MLLSTADRYAVFALVTLFVVLGGYSIRWWWSFYRQSTDNPSSMSSVFMNQQFAYANLFFCIAGGLLLYVFNVQFITPIMWAAFSTAWLVVSYTMLQYEMKRQKKGRK